ncbi:hypothetical protein O3G_MSEX000189 [Manduca sexta]|nr:hypothetical protein O3G_MSEX000189 [Manduca sexta]
MSTVRPIPASSHSKPSTFIFKELASATHVFLRDDTVRRPLQPPYTGPFRVVDRAEDGKTMTLDIKGKCVVVSVDRLKPAFIDHTNLSSSDSSLSEPPMKLPNVPGKSVLPQSIFPNSPPSVSPDKTATTTNLPYTTRSGRRVKFKDFPDFC